jgi:hypothetical protein
MPVERWYEQRDGVLSETAMRRKLEQRGYQVERCLYPPGTVFLPTSTVKTNWTLYCPAGCG